MDFTSQGFDWIVNLHQKFEAVCIEVEDKISQEAKYLESHMQNFYSDAIQDFLPSSCKAPVQEKVSGSSGVKNSDDVTHDHIKGKPSHEEVIVPVGQDCCQTADSTEECEIHDENQFVLSPSDVNLISKGSEKTLELNNILETSKLAIEKTRSVKNKKYASHPSELVPPVRNQASISSSSRKICLEPETSWEGVALSTHRDNEILTYKQFRVDQEEKALTMEPPSSEASTVLCSSRDCSASSVFNELDDEDHNRVGVLLPTLASTEVIGGLESSLELALCRNNVLAAVECIADDSSSYQSCDLDYPVVSPTESEGSFDVDTTESCMEKIEVFDNVNLGGSCIVVDNIDLQVPPRSSNRRSLKKTLQHALASRMRSTTQREYEQLAILYGDIDADFNEGRAYSTLSILSQDAHLKIPSAQDLCDSDWELV